MTVEQLRTKVCIIGSGPAGHTAAIYAARAGERRNGITAAARQFARLCASNRRRSVDQLILHLAALPACSPRTRTHTSTRLHPAPPTELQPVMLEGWLANGIAAGGQLTTTHEVENFPGFPEGIVGGEICERFRAQSLRFGTKIFSETVTRVDFSSRPFHIFTGAQG